MLVKDIKDEDFINYKKPSMVIAFPSCTFKCEKDCGLHICQNNKLVLAKSIEISYKNIIDRYIHNSITHSIVCAGLEPFDSWNDLLQLVVQFRLCTNDDIVIYTGYYPNEIEDKIEQLKKYPNIIVKFGRFIPNQKLHYDNILGVKLASENQYAIKIS